MRKISNTLSVWEKTSYTWRLFFSIINVVSALILGLTIYLVFVPTAHISQLIYDIIGINLQAKYNFKEYSIVKCYVADFLWAYALFNLIVVIQADKVKDFLCVGIECVLFACLIEALQLTPLFDGTFDVLDILVEVIAIGFAFFVIIASMFIKKQVN